MPAKTSIVLANGEATPVNHTFVPLNFDATTGIHWFEDQSPRVASSSPLGWPRIGIKTVRAVPQPGARATANDLVNKVEISIALPQMETLGTSDSGLTAPPTVAYVERLSITARLAVRDTLADRKDLRAYGEKIFANALVSDLFLNLSSLY